MSNTMKFPNTDEIEERTSDWLAAIDRGLTIAEQEELQNWLAESPVHGETLVHFASVWDLMDLVAPVAKVLPLDQPIGGLQHSYEVSSAGNEPRSFITGWLPVTGVLASLMVVVMVLATFPEPADTTFSSVYRTEIGEHSGVMLPDGSRLELNTNTEVSVHISETLRRVVLIRGEAYFDVAKNPEVPFVAEVGETQVIAVGTAFNIELLDANSIEVLVTEGKVLVEQAENSNLELLPQQLSFDETDNLLLTVGEKAVVSKNKAEQVSVPENFDVEADLAWREGMLIFEGESLDEAISEINRYTTQRLEIVDDSIREIEVGGYFRAGDTDELLVILENNFGIYHEQKGGRMLLRGKLQ